MSLEELVIADETFGMVSRLLRGVQVDEETLAVDLIKKMGFTRRLPVRAAHARARARALAGAPRARRARFESWRRSRRARARQQKARRTVDEILATPLPEADALPDDLGREFDAHHRLRRGAGVGMKRSRASSRPPETTRTADRGLRGVAARRSAARRAPPL